MTVVEQSKRESVGVSLVDSWTEGILDYVLGRKPFFGQDGRRLYATGLKPSGRFGWQATVS